MRYYNHLSMYVSVYFCFNFIYTDYISPQKSVRFNKDQTAVSYTIYTNEDSTLETKERCFTIYATYPSQPNNTDNCDTTTVCIIDDDGTYVHVYSKVQVVHISSTVKLSHRVGSLERE